MAAQGKNKGGEGTRGRSEFAAWFWPSVRKRKERNKLAKKARRKNR